MGQEKSVFPSFDQSHRSILGYPALIFLTCSVVYFIFWSGHHYSVDGVVMFEYAKALLFKGSLFIDPPLIWGTRFVTSKWPIGLSILYMPVLAILASTVFRGDPHIFTIPNDPSSVYSSSLFFNRPYMYSAWINPLVTALTAVLVFSLGLSLGLTKRQSCIAALIFGLFSPAAAYARFDFAQPLASLLLLAAVLFFTQARNSLIKKKVAVFRCFPRPCTPHQARISDHSWGLDDRSVIFHSLSAKKRLVVDGARIVYAPDHLFFSGQSIH